MASYTLTPFSTGTRYQHQVKNELGIANNNFTIIGQAFYNNDPTSQPILRAVYIGSSAPSNPVADQLWYDTSSNILKLYDGNNWNAINDLSTVNTQIKNINSAFLNNDPTSQPILRSVYINSSAPSNPVADMLWYDTSTNLLKLYDGNNWQSINDVSNLKSQISNLNSAFYNSDPTQPILRAVYIGSSAPSNPVADQLWYDTGNNLLKLYDGNNWQSINDVSTLKTQINNLNSAFYNNDPTSQPILRSVYINSSAPSNPVKGTTWLDTSQSTAVLKVYDGNNWQSNVVNANTVNNFSASQTPAPNIIVPLNANGILDLSSTFIKSNIYSFRRVDLTNANSDYTLQVGEEAVIYFDTTKSTSKNLRIGTQEGLYLMLIEVPYDTSKDNNNSVLYPNNQSYSNAMTYVTMWVDEGGSSTGAGSGSISSFKLSRIIEGGFQVHYISTFKTGKFMISLGTYVGSVKYGRLDYTVQRWNDTSTAWTSLGTIDTNNTSNGTMTVLVRRLA